MSLKRNILDLRKRKEIVLQGGGEDAIKKQAAMGKLTARERIEGILDKGSFHEYDMFVEHQSKDFDMDKKVRAYMKEHNVGYTAAFNAITQ